jgi:hypothetical protein
MKSKPEIAEFERVESQTKVFRREITGLARKRPNDGVNKFKLGYINDAVAAANAILGDRRPLQGFEQFNADDVPTNSDVSFVLAQYTEALYRLHVEDTRPQRGKFYWIIKNELSDVETKPPSFLAYTEKE